MKKNILSFSLLLMLCSLGNQCYSQKSLAKIVDAFLADNAKNFLFTRKNQAADGSPSFLLAFDEMSFERDSNCWIICSQEIKNDTVYIKWNPHLDCKYDFKVNRKFTNITSPEKNKTFAVMVNIKGDKYHLIYKYPKWVAAFNSTLRIENDAQFDLFPQEIYLFHSKIK